ncbi:MAG: NUDIX domain-containing protein [Candidatus Izimaplasma sp.]|nr:NUDIX domain-containing protein [Candidatus Izimaplasma bacterium]
MEIFDLYDAEFNKLDKTMPRGGSNNPGEYHLVVHVWIEVSKGKYLIQQRNKSTDLVPFQWGITSGAAIKGDTSINAAIRETKEEIGLILDAEDLNLIKRYFISHPTSNYITDVYLVKKSLALTSLILDPNEVKQVAVKTLPQIKEMIKQKTFWDYERLLERTGYFNVIERS